MSTARRYLGGPKPKKEYKGHFSEFSKIIVALVTFSYFIAFIIACVYLFKYGEGIGEFLLFVGGAVGVGLSGYSIKVTVENKVKVAKRMEQEMELLKNKLNNDVKNFIEGDEG